MNTTFQLDYDKYLINDFFLNLSFEEKLDLLDYHDYKNIIRSNKRLTEKQIHAISKIAVEKRGLSWARTILSYESQKRNIGRKITEEQIKHTKKRYLWRTFTNNYISSLQEECNELRRHFKKTYDAINTEYERQNPQKKSNYFNGVFDKQTSDILNK